jgi:hypothetical protein
VLAIKKINGTFNFAVSNQEEVATRQISGKIGNAKAHHYTNQEKLEKI